VKAGVALFLLLAGCGEAPPEPAAGVRLEQAAIAAGIVGDPAQASIAGAWAREGDRICVVPGEGTATRIGALVDYGDGQGCAAAGTVERHGERLDIRFGGCRIVARFDGERIALPAEVPAACDRLCSGRATLAALTVERQSGSVTEAATLRAPGGQTLCGG
jgi:hypothetical protein